MVFSSLFFLFAFLPLNLLLYSLAKTTPVRNAVLLVFSLIFYAWGEPVYMLLLIGMSFFDWLFARLMEKGGNRKLWLTLAVIVNLGTIGVFKYLNFLADNICGLFGTTSPIPAIMLPIGISFYTFQLLSYVIDVYRGEVKAQKKFFTVLLYASLFHQCIAGPIVRYQDVENELTQRRVDWADISEGIRRFCLGLGKKVFFANTCGNLADSLLGGKLTLEAVQSADGAALWVSMLAYMLQIYFDFSGYSDMAIGMGRMMGFHYLENFNYPYAARSVQDFWRRWHMSLSTFFRDYVYIPLGGSRCSFGRWLFNTLVVWALTGLWHGASWNFVLWGLFFFVFLVLEKVFLGKLLQKLPAVIGHLYLWVVVFFGWVLFRFPDLPTVGAAFAGMFGGAGEWMSTATSLAIQNNIFLIPFAILASTPLFKWMSHKMSVASGNSKVVANVWAVVQIVWPIVILGVCTILLVGDSYNPFLYFQF